MAKQEEATLWLKIKSLGEEVFGKISKGLDDVLSSTLAWAAGLVSLGAIVAKSIEQYKEKETAVRELTTAMINNGIYTVELANQYAKQAEELSNLSLFEDQQIIKAQAVIQQQIGQREVSEELTKSIMDLAQAKGMSLVNASEMVTKSIVGNRNALAQYKIDLDQTATVEERMTQAVDGLQRKFGGQAEAATQGLGSIDKMHKSMNDLYQVIGELLAPAVTQLAQDFTGLFHKMAELVNGNITTAKSYEEVQVQVLAVRRRMIELQDQIAEMKKDGLATLAEEGMLAGEEAKLAKLQAIRAKFRQDEKASEDAADEAKAETQAEGDVKELERQIKQQDIQMGMIVSQENFDKARLATQVQTLQYLADNESNAIKKAELLRQISDLKDVQRQKAKADLDKQITQDTFSAAASMANSGNKTLAAIGKAAAIYNITMQGIVAFNNARAIAPWFVGAALAAVSAATTASQLAQASGLQLAEGGIVMPRPGGIQATIGEGGQPEAVIPLDRASEFGMGGGGGGGISIVVYGGLLGDQSSAREFAIAIDRELLKLRQNNESQAFEGIVV